MAMNLLEQFKLDVEDAPYFCAIILGIKGWSDSLF